jgi:hypothetical protein
MDSNFSLPEGFLSYGNTLYCSAESAITELGREIQIMSVTLKGNRYITFSFFPGFVKNDVLIATFIYNLMRYFGNIEYLPDAKLERKTNLEKSVIWNFAS